MNVRASESADLRVLAALHAQCFARAWDEEFIGRLLAQPASLSLVATDCDEPAGFVLARVAAGEAEILSLGVIPRLRRCGFGAELVREVCGRAAHQGAHEVFLEVGAANEAARRLYTALCFREVGRRPEYYGDATGPARDALVLMRALPF